MPADPKKAWIQLACGAIVLSLGIYEHVWALMLASLPMLMLGIVGLVADLRSRRRGLKAQG